MSRPQYNVPPAILRSWDCWLRGLRPNRTSHDSIRNQLRACIPDKARLHLVYAFQCPNHPLWRCIRPKGISHTHVLHRLVSDLSWDMPQWLAFIHALPPRFRTQPQVWLLAQGADCTTYHERAPIQQYMRSVSTFRQRQALVAFALSEHKVLEWFLAPEYEPYFRRLLQNKRLPMLLPLAHPESVQALVAAFPQLQPVIDRRIVERVWQATFTNLLAQFLKIPEKTMLQHFEETLKRFIKAQPRYSFPPKVYAEWSALFPHIKLRCAARKSRP